MVTKRLAVLHSGQAIEGDLVLARAEDAQDDDDDEEDAGGEEEDEVEEDDDDRKSKQSSGSGLARGREGKHSRRSRGFPDVHVVTADEAVAGKYSINEVVMPLPGVFSRWPSHSVGLRSACELMRDDGVIAGFSPEATDDDLQALVVAAFSKTGTNLGRLGLPQMPGGYRQLVR